MALLPLFKDDNQQFMLLQSKWKSLLDPILAIPMLSGLLLPNVSLAGATIVPHRLSRVQQGWFIIDQNALSQVYRTAPFNNSTLTLAATNPVVVSLWVF
jgi:hypothetical protein